LYEALTVSSAVSISRVSVLVFDKQIVIQVIDEKRASRLMVKN
jgi:hypothetical protein